MTTLFAPAKLTTFLHMTGIRSDGFHLLEAEMVSVDLCDELTFSSGSGLSIMGNDGLSCGSDNLVNRALVACDRQARVDLFKRIPAGGGLGGGSADAAAVLRWAGVSDLAVAAGLGSDVPFCLRGGRALVSGIGDQIEALEFRPQGFTLLLPPVAVDTAAVYRAYDALASLGSHGEGWSERNHLQAAALAVQPALVPWKALLEAETGQEAVLAGSGSTWFVEGHWRSPDQDVLGSAGWVQVNAVPAEPMV